MFTKNILLGLLAFKGTTMLIGCYHHCKQTQFSQNNEEALLMVSNLIGGSTTTTTTTTTTNLKTDFPTTIVKHGHGRRHSRSQRQNHKHAIPNVLVFTHYMNLLELQHVNIRQQQEKVGEIDELLALQKNIRNTIDLHPNSTVRFLTDRDCVESIRNALSSTTTTTTTNNNNNHNNASDANKLVEYFQRETRGMYKSDICRGAALWETGGLYFDVDLGVRMSLWNVLGRYTKFVVPKVHIRSKQKPGFFQAFIGVTKHHPIMKRYLQLFLQYYDGRLSLETPLLKEHKQMLGVRILYIAYSQIRREEEEEKEVKKRRTKKKKMIADKATTTTTTTTATAAAAFSHDPARSTSTKMTTMTTISTPTGSNSNSNLNTNSTTPTNTNTSSSSSLFGPVELWQEVYYTRERFPFIAEPTWGTEKSCKFVVVANEGRWPPVVPFYSRVAGSRMCPEQ